MILFLNFAPIEFMGGAEKWISDVASKSNKYEETKIICVSESISNIYGKLILKRTFNNRSDSSAYSHVSITHLSAKYFIPFSKEWSEVRQIFNKARVIYMKFEILETFILLFFGGVKAFSKSIAGIHSPFIYKQPSNALEKLHNFLYTSWTSKKILQRMRTVHVLNLLDKEFFINKLKVLNIVHIPNYVVRKKFKNKKTSIEKLNIAFIGELNRRKGVDVLIEVIKKSPKHYFYNIAGDGPFFEKISKLTISENVKYHGFVSQNTLSEIIKNSDVLFLPSKAESFSLVSLEAMSYGLPVLNSNYIKMDFPDYLEYTTPYPKINEYLNLLKKIFLLKKKGILSKNKIKIIRYTNNLFSKDVILPRLLNMLFQINIK